MFLNNRLTKIMTCDFLFRHTTGNTIVILDLLTLVRYFRKDIHLICPYTQLANRNDTYGVQKTSQHRRMKNKLVSLTSVDTTNRVSIRGLVILFFSHQPFVYNSTLVLSWGKFVCYWACEVLLSAIIVSIRVSIIKLRFILWTCHGTHGS